MAETFRKLLELIQSNTTFAIVVAVTFLVTILFSLTIIFYKIRIKAWKGLIPIYNIMVLLDVLEIPVWMILVMFIPFVNFIGLPIMLIIIGWKLGSYCRKGILMRLGLSLFPPLFIPILSLCYIDIDGTEEYVEVVKIPEGFSLDVVEVSDVQPNLSAFSLADSTVIEKLAPTTTLRETAILKSTPPKNNNKNLTVGPAANEIEDLNKVLPTADDLTMDYNSLYTKSLKEKESPKEEEKPLEETPLNTDVSNNQATLDYTLLYNNTPVEETEKIEEKEADEKVDEDSNKEEIIEEPIPEEEPEIIIHDVVLEAAEPITENIGPIPINRRYDFQTNKKEVKEEILEETSVENEEPLEEMSEINPLTPPVIAPLIKDSEKVEETSMPAAPIITNNGELPSIEKTDNTLNDLPMQAVNPLDLGNAPTLANIPDLILPSAEAVEKDNIVNTNVNELQGMREINAVESGTRVDQIVSMNIAEPSQLPVGVLTNAPGKKEEKPPAVEPTPQPVIPQQPQPVNPNMTREEAMGFRQNYFFNANSTSPNSQVASQGNSYMTQPVMSQPMNGMATNMGYNQQATQQMMNQPRMQPMGANPMMAGQMMRQPNPMPQQPINAASIFQVNAPNGSLLRPVETNTPVSEKICPICGVKLKQEAPICIMCGYKF